jgi:hypothetical protein
VRSRGEVLHRSVGAFYMTGREAEVVGIGGAAAVNAVLNGAVSRVMEEGGGGGGRLQLIEEGAEFLSPPPTVGVSPWRGGRAAQRRVRRRQRSTDAGEGGRGRRGMAWWADSAYWACSGTDGQWAGERKNRNQFRI